MLSTSLFKKEIYDLRWLMSLGLILLIAVGGFLIFSYDWIVTQLGGIALEELTAPQWLTQTVQNIPKLKDFEFAIWSNWNPKNLVQIGSLMAILMGSLTFAGDIERRTISFLLTNRLTREQVFRTKVLATMCCLGIVFMIPSFLLPIFCTWSGRTLTSLRIVGVSFLTFCGGVCLLSLTIFFAILFQDRMKTIIAMIVLVFVQIAVGFMPVLKYLSIYNYTAAPAYYFGIQPFPWLTAAVLCLISGLILKLSEYCFNKSDFS